MTPRVFSLVLCLAIASCFANGERDAASNAPPSGQAASGTTLRDEALESARQRKEDGEPTKLDLLNELLRRGSESGSQAPTQRQVRIVPTGARPEVVISSNVIRIEGKSLHIGDALDTWRAAIPGQPRCSSGAKEITLCTWDDLGIQAGTSLVNQSAVDFLTIHVNLEALKPAKVGTPGGLDSQVAPPYWPTRPFTGYLELDGYGIDAKTAFWEIQSRADSTRKLRCGLRDCAHPHGRFDEKASLQLRLTGPESSASIYELSVAGNLPDSEASR